MMTISEIADKAIMPREPLYNTVVLPVDVVNALIADWRITRDALNRVKGMKDVTCTDSCQADLFAQVCQDALDELKLKP